MLQTAKKLLFFLSSKERKFLPLLLLMILIMALLDMIGVASIMPFIAVLTNPVLIETNDVLNILFKFFTKFGVESSQDFLFILGILVFVLLVVSVYEFQLPWRSALLGPVSFARALLQREVEEVDR